MINIKDLTAYDPKNPRVNTYFSPTCHNVCFIGFKDNKIYVNDFTFSDTDEHPFEIYGKIFDRSIITTTNIGEAFGIAEAIQDCVDKGEDTSQVIKRIVDGAA